MRRAAIHGLGSALPEQVVTSAEVAERIGVDEHWIMKRMGVAQRHVARPDERLDELAAIAARIALDDAGIRADQLDLVIVATFTAEEGVPHAAPLVATAIGADRAGAFDVGAACTGWISGLATAASLIETGRMDNILLIGAEIMSRIIDPMDKSTAGLMADGAGATVIGPATGSGMVREIVLHADGTDGQLVAQSRRTDNILRMAGQETFAMAVDNMTSVTHEILERAGLGLDDVGLFVYHQANARILRSVAQRLGLSDDPRIPNYIAETGNTSAASIPITLERARREGLLEPGMRVLTAAIGSGFVWGAALIEWE
jgi:3-oxoacyl-[acyl-carrier-protein] synthase-3